MGLGPNYEYCNASYPWRCCFHGHALGTASISGFPRPIFSEEAIEVYSKGGGIACEAHEGHLIA